MWAYIGGRFGDSAVSQALDEALRSRSSIDALEKVTGMKEKELSAEWHEAVRALHGPVLSAGKRASLQARSLTADQTNRGAFAISPSLSPDGTRIVYLSERDMLSVDLYLADAETGEIIRKLVNTAIDPHFASLQFISSAGSWHPKGGQFAFGAIREGQPALAIIDVSNGDKVRDILFPNLGEIVNPAWSPDGKLVAFTATKGGYSDLYTYDLEQSTLRQLTDDAFADLQPAWSPDGRQLVFATDRFTTDLSVLQAGTLSLALLDVSSGRVEALRTFERGKKISPQWAADGRRVYFLSDASGLTDVYVVEIADGKVNRVTGLDAGASGITALSPGPLDVARCQPAGLQRV